MNRKIALAAVAALAALTTAASPQSSAAAHTMTIQSAVHTAGAVPTFAVHCRGASHPLLTVVAKGKPGTRVSYIAWINNQAGARGAVTADKVGNFVVNAPVLNKVKNAVRLQLMSHTALTGYITPTCAVPTTTSVAAPAGNASRGSKTAYVLNHNSNGTVARWNPCDGDIHVLVNAAKGGAGALADAQAALASLSSSTGLHFVYDGPTTFVPSSGNSSSQPAKLVIAWAPPGSGAGQSNYYASGAVGEGGWRSSGTSSNGGATWNWKIVQGFVVIDPSVSMAPGFGNGVTRGALLLHELGHVVGLGHSSDGTQVMYPVLRSTSFGSYGAGDLAGLHAVGASNGCTSAA